MLYFPNFSGPIFFLLHAFATAAAPAFSPSKLFYYTSWAFFNLHCAHCSWTGACLFAERAHSSHWGFTSQQGRSSPAAQTAVTMLDCAFFPCQNMPYSAPAKCTKRPNKRTVPNLFCPPAYFAIWTSNKQSEALHKPLVACPGCVEASSSLLSKLLRYATTNCHM